MAARDWIEAIDLYFRQMGRTAIVMADLHWELARQEALRERQRLSAGLGLMAGGLALVGTGLALTQVAAVWGLRALGLAWPGAILAVAAIDVALGFGLAIAGSRVARGPYMAQTQIRLARTSQALLGAETGTGESAASPTAGDSPRETRRERAGGENPD